MVSEKLTITNKMGLHMRPAGTFVGEMGKFKCDVNIIFNGKPINGKSIMNVMAACIKYGSEITIECSGEDENEALSKAVELVKSGFGEE